VDHGQSWQRLSSEFLGQAIDAIAIDPTNSSTLYIATVGGRGVYKSTDGGATWSSPNVLPSCYTIAIDPSTPDVLYVGTSFGVSKSTNGGASFTSVSRGLPSYGVTALAIDPVNPTTVYAAGRFVGVYKTTDGGANWTKKKDELFIASIAVDRTNPANVLMTTDGHGNFKSTDGSETWSAANAGMAADSTLGLWIDPLDSRIVYTGTSLKGVFRSTDGGATWSQLGSMPSEAIVSVTTEPGGNIIHVAGRGGVYSYEIPGNSQHSLPRRRAGR
jgi:photosystem II stability/assembly factor-like uncharacterized protein